MKTITLYDIRKLKPCYDPGRYAPDDWSGTLIDILKAEQIPASDRIWVVTQYLGDRTNRLFAVWCARQAIALIENPDPRSIAACDVAEKFANCEATMIDMDAVGGAAWDAAWAAAMVGGAAWAAWDTTAISARDAARAAAVDAAIDDQIAQLAEMIEAQE